MKQTLFITGTDTNVGKTVLAVLLTRFLRACGVPAAGVKPVSSGSRGDARALHAAMDGALRLDEINPWHFRAPVTPWLAARLEHKRVELSEVISHFRALHKRFDLLVVEGAGGLLSPLGEAFDSRDLITALAARPVVVARNCLGAVNQVLLTLEALPKSLRSEARIVMVSPLRPDASTRSNPRLLAELTGAEILSLPWLRANLSATKNPTAQKTLRSLAAG